MTEDEAKTKWLAMPRPRRRILSPIGLCALAWIALIGAALVLIDIAPLWG